MTTELLNPQEVKPPTDPINVNEALATEASLEAVAMRFSPRSEVDTQGLTRLVFEYEGVSFSFQGRDETPDIPVLDHSRPDFIGHESFWLNWRDNDKPPIIDVDLNDYRREHGWSEEEINEANNKVVATWQTEKDRLEGYKTRLHELSDANNDGPKHFQVEQSPLGVYGLLEVLQPDNPKWKEKREAVEKGIYDDEALSLIDVITGLNAISGNTNDPPLGEVVAVSALLGDEMAQAVSLSALDKQSDLETRIRARISKETEEWAQRPRVQEVEAYKPEDLVAVHATSYLPDEYEGGYRVETTFDATGFPRSTIHTSLNHLVNGHLYGSWDSREYVLIAGLDRMIDSNGGPNSSNGADTWWTRNPGEKLNFPDGTLVAPGGSQEGLVVRDGSKIMYKSEGITNEEVEAADPDIRIAIKKALNIDGKEIDLTSAEGQQIAAAAIRSSIVFSEITVARGKAILQQYDDKFMKPDDSIRIGKMYHDLGIDTYAALHNGGSDEGIVENRVGNGDRILLGTYDAKIRRVAYASGMMSSGGKRRQLYEDSKNDPIF